MTGVELTPQIAAWLSRGRQLSIGLDSALTFAGRRQRQRELSDILFAEFGAPSSGRSERREHMVTASGIELRLREYRPRGSGSTRLPAMLTLHGGGFWHGSIDEALNIAVADERAAESRTAIFAVEYRLAPEYPFPVPGEDAVAAGRFLFQNAERLRIDANRIVLGGTSAGANLAVLVARVLGASGLRAAGLLLEVPAVDLRDRGTWLAEFAELNGIGTVAELRTTYAPHLADDDPAISPVTASDLSLLPPTHIMTAEFDPLRDGGELLAERIRASAVPVTMQRYPAELHGSSNLTAASDSARLWQADAAKMIRYLANV